MTTETDLSPQEHAQQIWDQFDTDEAQGLPSRPTHEPEPREEQASEPAAQAPAELHNDEVSADVDAQDAVSPDTQALLDRISGLELTLTQQAQRLRQAEGRIGGLNSQLQQATQKAGAAGADVPTERQIAEARKSPQAMSRLREDYPEFGAAMEDALNERIAEIEARLKSTTPAQPDAQGRALTAVDLERMREELRAELAVDMRHEGWKNTVKEPAFIGWLDRQPREVQMLAASDSPRDAIRLLDLYGEARSTKSTRTQRLASAAAMPNGRQARGATRKSVDDMTGAEYWRYLDEQEAAKAAQGR